MVAARRGVAVAAAVVAAMTPVRAGAQSGPQGASQGPLPEVVTRSRVDQGRGVDFHAIVVPETVYVGQQATYQLGVFLDQDTRQRIRRNPEFQPPETRALLSYDLREPAGGTVSATIGGRAYEAHIFRRALFPLAPGRYAIPPARLSYALPQTASFFSREENFTLRAEAVAIVAVQPPAAGRPDDWAGAVGAWRVAASVDTARGRAGDPFILTVRVSGSGNVTLLPRPRVSVAWASVVNADERVRLDSSPPLLGGWKEFDWLVTPTASGSQRVPPVRYAYFNPRTRRYEVAETAPIDVRVAAGDVAAVPVADAAPPPRSVPSLRPGPGPSAPRPISRSWGAALLVVMAPLLTLGAWVGKRPPRPRPVPTPLQRISTAREAASSAGLRDVRRAFVDGLRLRTGVDPAAFTTPGALSLELRKAGLSERSALAVERLLAALDASCFGPGRAETAVADWADQAREALAIVDDEACTGGRRPAPGLAGVAILVAALLGGANGVAGAQGAPDAFAMGATAYAGADYVRAARYFADAAQEAPRSVAAWANLGTSAWLARDTAMAVVGWQRALRLSPWDREIRAHLSQVRAPQETAFARVPPVPEWLATGFALLIWLAGWGVATRQAWRRRPARRMALVTLVAGGLALAAAYRLTARLEGEGLAVVTAPAPLRALPALGADTRATPMLGEVAAIDERSGVWVRVRLDGGREGWLPAERVTPLARD